MTAYFDEKTAEVSEAAARYSNDDAWLRHVANLEEDVARDVSLCVGDREFPDDLRQKALEITTNRTVRTIGITYRIEPLPDVLEEARVGKISPMLDALHGLFHEVARRRTTTRFGILSDSPAGNLERRDAHDAVAYRCAGGVS